jgi:hypothetical protein
MEKLLGTISLDYQTSWSSESYESSLWTLEGA